MASHRLWSSPLISAACRALTASPGAIASKKSCSLSRPISTEVPRMGHSLQTLIATWQVECPMPGALRQALTSAYKKRALSILHGVKKVPFKPEPPASHQAPPPAHPFSRSRDDLRSIADAESRAPRPYR